MFLLADPAGTLVAIPHLVGGTRAGDAEVARVRFEGDVYETEFGGEGRSVTYSLTARYAFNEHAQWKALRGLLEAARTSPDRRLGLRTRAGQVPGLDDFTVVTVSNVTETPLGGQAWDVSFTASAVQHELV